MSAKTGNRFETNRLHFLVRQHQNELSHLDWLVGPLERRFTDAWAELDGELG